MSTHKLIGSDQLDQSILNVNQKITNNLLAYQEEVKYLSKCPIVLYYIYSQDVAEQWLQSIVTLLASIDNHLMIYSGEQSPNQTTLNMVKRPLLWIKQVKVLFHTRYMQKNLLLLLMLFLDRI